MRNAILTGILLAMLGTAAHAETPPKPPKSPRPQTIFTFGNCYTQYDLLAASFYGGSGRSLADPILIRGGTCASLNDVIERYLKHLPKTQKRSQTIETLEDRTYYILSVEQDGAPTTLYFQDAGFQTMTPPPRRDPLKHTGKIRPEDMITGN